ncbi:hypothetical protein ABZ863_32310 [Saccharomonospora sp. NPDC046836]|uniref:hypothetical protein n=1 Tax=Saccharomonospora sp. NPDC046836 TaxID=3156921 RepID=UPI0033F04D3D
MKVVWSRRGKLLVGAAAVVVLVLVVGVVLAYPAWSARRGADARWVVASNADTVLDYDADRVLVEDDGLLTVLDRATGEDQSAGRVDWQQRAALVPGGVVASADGYLALRDRSGRVMWEKTDSHTLVTVDIGAGVAVVAVEGTNRVSTLTALALTDGTPKWTIPDLGRVGNVSFTEEPARRPGALRTTRLIPVIPMWGYPSGTAATPATWQLVSAATGEVVAETVQTDDRGVPFAFGDAAMHSDWPSCAEVALIGGPQVRWPDGPPEGTCGTVWLVDPERVLIWSWREPGSRGGEEGIRLFSLRTATGTVTELNWQGGYLDTTGDEGRELARSWGRYLFSKGAVYDTRTGEERWRAEEVWLSGDTAVTVSGVSGIDRLAAGASDRSRWVRVTDAATGEPNGGAYITLGPVYSVTPLDLGEVLVLAGGEAVLLSR